MNKKKMHAKEQSIINFINNSISNDNLKYVNIKNKINLNIEEKEENYSPILKRNLVYKLSFITVFILSLVLTFSIILTKNQPNLNINSSLTDTLMNDKENSNLKPMSVLDYTHKFYNIYASTSEDSSFYQNGIPVEITIGDSSKNYQYAYLHEDVIDEVNTFFDNITDLSQYYLYEEKLNYSGINNIYSKYQYYLYINNIEISNERYQLKWLEDSTKKVPYQYRDYRLILAVEINEIKEAIDLTNKQVINTSLEYIVEMNVSINKNKVNINDRYNSYEALCGNYLFYIDKNYQTLDKLSFSENYLYKVSSKVTTINNQKLVYGELPEWYVKILNNEYVLDFYKTYYPEVNDMLNSINNYYIKYEAKQNYNFKTTIYQVYYSYDIIEIFLK